MQRRDFLPVLLLVLAGSVAYLNSLSAPFLFDDFFHIVQNHRIRDLAQPAVVLGGTARPLTALTLAVNYALGGLDVRGYHLFNLAVHLLAGLVLFGIIRRTARSAGLALAASLLWLIHPLQTQSVTYVIQRGESLMGLFYLLTLYCVIRKWHAAAVLACALGMLTKPVMVTAPLVVLIYDRIFLASSWKELLREHWKLYAGLAATWGLLLLALANGPREYQGLAGMGVDQISPLAYLRTQPGVILHYLRLSFWPDPLILDYQWPVSGWREALLPAAAMLGLLGLTAWGLLRRPAIGFLGVWFFLILAPTSSFIPIVDPAFEHRMYLPLAAAILLFLLAWRKLAGGRRLLFWILPLALAPAFLLGTLRRNELYNNPAAFWEQQVTSRPGNVRAWVSYGVALQQAGKPLEARKAFQQALAIRPDSAVSRNNLADLLLREERLTEAEAEYKEALRLDPGMAMAHKGLGMTLHQMGRLEEAAAEYQEALRLNPVYADARLQLGLVRQAQGRPAEALAEYKEALRLDPREPAAYNNIGTLLFEQGQWEQAAALFRRALELKPDYPEARKNLGQTLKQPKK